MGLFFQAVKGLSQERGLGFERLQGVIYEDLAAVAVGRPE